MGMRPNTTTKDGHTSPHLTQLVMHCLTRCEGRYQPEEEV